MSILAKAKQMLANCRPMSPDVVTELVAEIERLQELFGSRFHTDSACGSCGGPLDVERDAICCRCTDDPDLAANQLRAILADVRTSGIEIIINSENWIAIPRSVWMEASK